MTIKHNSAGNAKRRRHPIVGGLGDVWHIEPIRIGTVVIAVVACAVAFGAPINDKQRASIEAVVTAVVALAGGEAVRRKVTPNVKLKHVGVDPDAVAAQVKRDEIVKTLVGGVASSDGTPSGDSALSGEEERKP